MKIKASFVNFGLCNSVKAEQQKQLDEGVSDISQVLFVTLNWCLCIWGKPLWEQWELKLLQVEMERSVSLGACAGSGNSKNSSNGLHKFPSLKLLPKSYFYS